jgi:Zn-dependent protease
MEINFLQIAIALVVILFCMTLHEAMHGFMAYYLGDDTAKLQGRLTLNPIKHIDPFLTIILPVLLVIMGGPIFGGAKPVPFNPNRVRYDEWGAALVALAGPLTNLLLAFIAFGVYVATGMPVTGLWSQIIVTTVMVNLGFFIFNMIPIPPLDGSRVLYALAPDFVRRGMEVIEQYGLILVFAIVLLASSAIGTLMTSAMGGIIYLFTLMYGVA